MKKLVNTTLAMIFSLAVFSCQEELEVVQVVNEEFDEITEIEIESGFLEVTYQGIEGKTTVSMEGKLESSRSGKFRIDYELDETKLKVRLDQNGPFGGGRNRGHIFISGPLEMDLEVDGGSGRVFLSGVKHSDMKVAMGSGSLEIQDINVGNMDIQVGSGSIFGYDLKGNLRAQAGSGKIALNTILGNVNIVASSGNVELSKIHGSLNSEISSGRLQMRDVTEIQSIKISSGMVEGTRVGLGPKTVLTGSSGNFKIQTLSSIQDYNYDFQAGSGRIVIGESSSSGSLKINNGSPYTIRGNISSGNIEIIQ